MDIRASAVTQRTPQHAYVLFMNCLV
uniref:Uncharacterized protein n=1 Tax=Anguilla anguilla TaxID=7936 RepID=A0A0E9VMF7_ANGAN